MHLPPSTAEQMWDAATLNAMHAWQRAEHRAEQAERRRRAAKAEMVALLTAAGATAATDDRRPSLDVYRVLYDSAVPIPALAAAWRIKRPQVHAVVNDQHRVVCRRCGAFIAMATLTRDGAWAQTPGHPSGEVAEVMCRQCMTERTERERRKQAAEAAEARERRQRAAFDMEIEGWWVDSDGEAVHPEMVRLCPYCNEDVAASPKSGWHVGAEVRWRCPNDGWGGESFLAGRAVR